MIDTIQTLLQYVIDNNEPTTWSNAYALIKAKPSRLNGLIRITVEVDSDDHLMIFSYFVEPVCATDNALLQSHIDQFKLDIQAVATDWDSRGGYWKQKATKLTSGLTSLGL